MYEQIKTFVRKHKKISGIYRKVIKADVVEQKFMDLEEKLIYKYIFQLEKRVEALENRLEIPSLSPVILSSTEGEPNLDNPISQVATSSQLHSPIFNIWTERLNLPNYPNRKTWEFVYICQVLEKNQMISATRKGVGFGVGKDPIVAYLAKNRVNILATDLHTDEAKTAGWVDTNQHLNNVKDLNYRGITSDTNLKQHVKFRFVDMNHIPEDVQAYDFTWSACAFEHLGSIEKGFEFVKNSLKCLKPGGLAVHTTEFNVSSNEDTVDNQATVLFRKRDFEKLAAELQKDGHEIAFNFNTGNSSFDKYYDIPPYSDYTHLKLLIDKYVSTSIGLVIKKAE